MAGGARSGTAPAGLERICGGGARPVSCSSSEAMAAAAMASLELGPWREAQTRGPRAQAVEEAPRGGRGRKKKGGEREEADIWAPHVRVHITAQSTCHISFWGMAWLNWT